MASNGTGTEHAQKLPVGESVPHLAALLTMTQLDMGCVSLNSSSEYILYSSAFCLHCVSVKRPLEDETNFT